MFAIAWEYLTGRAVATDPTDRQTTEWPPHPDRVFQALVAAWGAAGEPEAGRTALAWLGALPAPALAADEPTDRQAPVKVYVPINDSNDQTWTSGGKRKFAQSMRDLGLGRDRQPRYFPGVPVAQTPCALIWPDADAGEHRQAFAALCAGITNIGHASSLVRVWVAEAPPEPTWVPAIHERRAALRLRVPDAFRLDQLVAAFAGGGPDWKRPPMARWQGYQPAADPVVPRGAFSGSLIVLRRVDGDRPGLIQTSAFTAALRGTLLAKVAEIGKALVSGHASDGSPAIVPHLAYLPMAFVDADYADGHVLGLALALPNNVDPTAESALWDAIDAAADEAGELHLVAGPAGAITLAVEQRPNPPRNLQAEPWTRPSTTWATVTPIVLDRMPPRRHEDADGWTAEQIAMACRLQGLPVPCAIALPGSSVLRGVPPAAAFPPLLRKDGSRRWHVHARITFPVPVAGPLLLGAGRFRGLGLCRPHSD